jgi:hypothetical protein
MVRYRGMAAVLAMGLLVAMGTTAGAAENRSYRTHLSGEEEVPARATDATGQANLKLSKDGEQLYCKLIAANIENVVAAHIHLGPAGQNGPVVAFLYGPEPAGGGRVQGVLSETTITGASLIGPMAGGSVADLVAEIEAGNAYVNVHTNDGEAPTNTGPGDFPGGEIRGQIWGAPRS